MENFVLPAHLVAILPLKDWSNIISGISLVGNDLSKPLYYPLDYYFSTSVYVSLERCEQQPLRSTHDRGN